MIELINLLLLLGFILAVGYISEKQHDYIKEEIKKLNDKIDQLKKIES